MTASFSAETAMPGDMPARSARNLRIGHVSSALSVKKWATPRSVVHRLRLLRLMVKLVMAEMISEVLLLLLLAMEVLTTSVLLLPLVETAGRVLLSHPAGKY